ncbi:MAG: hypothetical protein GXP14_08995 [Gammaproteobacteria bacterium]|nr:hypothetical protein [Gammaproteobacteria bacterium]
MIPTAQTPLLQLESSKFEPARQLLERHAMPDHIHLVLMIPPKFSVAMVVGYLKGKSAIQIHRESLGVRVRFFDREGTV